MKLPSPPLISSTSIPSFPLIASAKLAAWGRLFQATQYSIDTSIVLSFPGGQDSFRSSRLAVAPLRTLAVHSRNGHVSIPCYRISPARANRSRPALLRKFLL
jgi:hypothetical protein